jgi:Fe-S-cluster containining protein
MRETNKITKLLSGKCGQCGICCCDPIIELTHHDLKRLVQHTKIPAESLIKLYDSSELNPDGEDNDWINLSYGKRKLGLRKKRNGECIFLSDKKQCTAYAARPLSCRIFPIDVILDESYEFTDLELSEIIRKKIIKCRRSSGRSVSLKKFLPLAHQAQAETVSFWDTLNKWNTRTSSGKKNDFLKFLRLND